MQYLGGKYRLAKHLVPNLAESLGRTDFFVEPFVGGFNLLPALHAAGIRPRRILCADAHPGPVTMYRALQAGWDPPSEVSEERWAALREDADWDNPETAFAAFGCSFGGMEWGGYARNLKGRNYAAAARNSLLRKRPALAGVELLCCDYRDLPLGPGAATIYADPPYRGTASYGRRAFDSDLFYDWCEHVWCAHDVYVSEFSVPPTWEVVWRTERSRGLRTASPTTVTELLARPARTAPTPRTDT